MLVRVLIGSTILERTPVFYIKNLKKEHFESHTTSDKVFGSNYPVHNAQGSSKQYLQQQK